MIFKKLFSRKLTPAKPEGMDNMSNMNNRVQGEIGRRQNEISELQEIQNLLNQRDDLVQQIQTAEAKLIALNQQIAGADQSLAEPRQRVKNAEADVARIEFQGGIGEEVKRLRRGADAAVALTDDSLSKRAMAYLRSRNWTGARGGWSRAGMNVNIGTADAVRI